jgi:hypothetical protein
VLHLDDFTHYEVETPSEFLGKWKHKDYVIELNFIYCFHFSSGMCKWLPLNKEPDRWLLIRVDSSIYNTRSIRKLIQKAQFPEKGKQIFRTPLFVIFVAFYFEETMRSSQF